MKNLTFSILLILSHLLFVNTAAAQVNEWKEFVTKSQEQLNLKNYSEAEKTAQKAIEFAEEKFGFEHPNFVKSLIFSSSHIPL